MFNCHICNAVVKIKRHKIFDRNVFVSSDAKIVKSNQDIGYCDNCHNIVKNISPKWNKTVSAIYNDYDIYHQSNGAEKLIFDGLISLPIPRSEYILRYLETLIPIENYRSALDLGTGSGAMLKAILNTFPWMEVSAFDIDTRYKDILLESIPIKKFYSENIANIDQKFDIITLIHVLEHITDPKKFLDGIKNLLSDDGILVIAVPNPQVSIFDILTYDHASHFSCKGLSMILGDFFRSHILGDGIVGKEIISVATNSTKYLLGHLNNDVEKFVNLDEILAAIFKILNKPESIIKDRKFAIYGASVAGLWISELYKDFVINFFDDDQNKINNYLNGFLINDPKMCKENTDTLLIFDEILNLNIKNRHPNLNCF